MKKQEIQSSQDKTVGVLGGMGPAATSRFFDLLLQCTPADKDQEHVKIIIYNNPNIPDRANYLVSSGNDPRPHLLEGVNILEEAGADLLTIPCNTAHAFIADVQKEASIPVLDMIKLTSEHINESIGGSRIGLLSTRGTIQTEVYHEKFSDRSLDIIIPGEDMQDEVTTAIHEIKSGRHDEPRNRLRTVVGSFSDIDAVIAGCTEIPLVLAEETVAVQLIDPMEILADEAIWFAKTNTNRSCVD